MIADDAFCWLMEEMKLDSFLISYYLQCMFLLLYLFHVEILKRYDDVK